VLVRCLMIPALVALFGPLNWWMPRPLARALRLPVVPTLTSDVEEQAAEQTTPSEPVPGA
jgi:RND superfamily putative drug exporter